MVTKIQLLLSEQNRLAKNQVAQTGQAEK